MLAETEDIRAISYDEVSGTVTISGAFDPLLLPCKLRRKAGWLIRDIQLVAAELRLTPQRPAMLPNPSGGLAALDPSCCCGICGCGGLQWLRPLLLRLPGVRVRQPPAGGLLQGATVGAVPKDHLRLRGGVVSCVQDHVMCLLPGLP